MAKKITWWEAAEMIGVVVGQQHGDDCQGGWDGGFQPACQILQSGQVGIKLGQAAP